MQSHIRHLLHSMLIVPLIAGSLSAQTGDQVQAEALIKAAIHTIDDLEAFEIECSQYYNRTETLTEMTKAGRVKMQRYPDNGFLLHVIGDNGSEAMLSPDTCIGMRAGSKTVAVFLKSNIVSSNPDSVFLDTYRLAMAPEWMTRILSTSRNEPLGLLHRMLHIDKNRNVEHVRFLDEDSVWSLVYNGTDSVPQYTEDSLILVGYTWIHTLKFRKQDTLPVFTEWRVEQDGELDIDSYTINKISFNPQMISIDERLEQLGPDYTVKVIQPKEHTPLELGTPINWSGRYLDGDTVSSDDLKGGYVLYKFMYRGCGPCHDYIPFMKHMQTEHPELTLLELDPYDQGDEDKMRKYQEKNDIDYPLVFISREDPKRLNVPGFPTFYMVDPDGNLVWQGRGIDDPKKMAKQIAEIIGTPGQ